MRKGVRESGIVFTDIIQDIQKNRLLFRHFLIQKLNDLVGNAALIVRGAKPLEKLCKREAKSFYLVILLEKSQGY